MSRFLGLADDGSDAYRQMASMKNRGAGGTAGGVGQFFAGVGLAGLGMYLFLDRVHVMSNMSSMWGGHFGLVLLPLGLGIALLFFSARSILGWLLTVGSLVAVFASIITNLTFLFMPTNFFRTTGMIALLFIGLVMIARSFRSR